MPCRFPAASTRVETSSAESHCETSRWQSRIGGDKNVRRVPAASSLKRASVWQRARTFSAVFKLVVSTCYLPFPADARFDVTVGFIDGHKDLIGIVLAKTRKVHGQAMQI